MVFIISSFLFRITIIFYNYFYGPIPGAEYDALAFHQEAQFYSNYLNDKNIGMEEDYEYKIGWYYSNFLGFFYNKFENYQMLYASFFSCIAWLLSSLILNKILNIFEIDKIKINLILFVYCWLFPTSIVYNSITLREPYILFLLNFLALIVINIFMNNKKVIKIFLLAKLAIILIPFYLLHDANILFIIIISAIILIYKIFDKLLKKNSLLVVSFIFIFIFILADIWGLKINEFFFTKIIEYRLGHFELHNVSRAYYDTEIRLQNLNYDLFRYINFLIVNFINYMFQPIPWKATSLKDLILIFENFLRFFIYLIMIIKFTKNKKKNINNKLLIQYLFIALILMEFIYSQVTVNWGTASRHHVVTMGLLLIVASLLFKKNKTDIN